MAIAKEFGVPTRKQTRNMDGKTTTTWRSMPDVARDCQEAFQRQRLGCDVPGSASAYIAYDRVIIFLPGSASTALDPQVRAVELSARLWNMKSKNKCSISWFAIGGWGKRRFRERAKTPKKIEKNRDEREVRNGRNQIKIIVVFR